MRAQPLNGKESKTLFWTWDIDSKESVMIELRTQAGLFIKKRTKNSDTLKKKHLMQEFHVRKPNAFQERQRFLVPLVKATLRAH